VRTGGESVLALLETFDLSRQGLAETAWDGIEHARGTWTIAARGFPAWRTRARLHGVWIVRQQRSPFTVEVEVKHPTLVRTSETVRGSQIMSDSPWCDAFIDGIRAEMTVRVISFTNNEVVAQNSDQVWINASKLLDDSVCPDGIITRENRHEVASLEASADIQGVSVPSSDIQIPVGYVGAGVISIPVNVSFEGTGRGTFQGERESDRGQSTFVVPGRARIEPARSAVIQGGNLPSGQTIILMRVD
jgi:hypothetical protein